MSSAKDCDGLSVKSLSWEIGQWPLGERKKQEAFVFFFERGLKGGIDNKGRDF